MNHRTLKRNILTMLMLMLSMVMVMACNGTVKATEDNGDRYDAGNGDTLTIHPIKHGSLRMTYGKYEIEVDPCNNIPPKTDDAHLPKADLILVTHEHFDHFDLHAVGKAFSDGKKL